MKIGIILGSSQINKIDLLLEATKKYAINHEVINFGCFDNENYSYIEVSIMIGLLINSEAIDFIITGCSSGQGMMLACNNMPNVICGYSPSFKDAYLFAQINNGNVISLPLGENYTYTNDYNCIKTIEMLFCEPFGQGYPKEEAERKLKDSQLLKDIKYKSQIDFISLLNRIDNQIIQKVIKKKDLIDYIMKYGKNRKITEWIKQKLV